MTGPTPVDFNEISSPKEIPLPQDSPPPTPPPSSGLAALFGFSRSDQWFLGLVCTIGLLALVVFTARLQGWGDSPLRFDHSHDNSYRFQIDINRATWIEWAQLEGLGEKLAREIVADRQANGPFRNADDLIRVKGIGPKNLERFRPWLKIEPPTTPPAFLEDGRDNNEKVSK